MMLLRTRLIGLAAEAHASLSAMLTHPPRLLDHVLTLRVLLHLYSLHLNSISS